MYCWGIFSKFFFVCMKFFVFLIPVLCAGSIHTSTTLVPSWLTTLGEIRQNMDGAARSGFVSRNGKGGDLYVQMVRDRIPIIQPASFEKSTSNRIVWEMISFIKLFKKSSREITNSLNFRYLRILGILDSLLDLKYGVKIDYEEAYNKKFSQAEKKGIAAVAAISEWKSLCIRSSDIIAESLRIIARLSLVPSDLGDFANIIDRAKSYQSFHDKNGSNNCGSVEELLKRANSQILRSNFLSDIRNLTNNQFVEHIEPDAPQYL